MTHQGKPRDPEAREARRAALARQRGAAPGLSGQMPYLPPKEAPPKLKGREIGLAWGIGLLALLFSGATGVLMATALITPISVSAGVLKLLLALPIIGGVVALPALALALLATRRARQTGARIAAPVVLVGVTLALVLTAIFFGGLVTVPRSRLATFAQTIQMHCARVAQVLAPYGNPPDATKVVANARAVLVALQGAASLLPQDKQALDALTAPDPTYQPLVEDCRALVQDDVQFIAAMQQALIQLPPDADQVKKTVMDYETTTSKSLAEVQQLGAQLAHAVFAPFQQG
ncbi:MAG TPA: hypothetical protein VH540_10375 [Ktedonobacterales bacterium]